MTPEFVVQLIGSIGFPAAMCFYVLHVTNQKIEKLTETVANLTTVVARLEVHNEK